MRSTSVIRAARTWYSTSTGQPRTGGRPRGGRPGRARPVRRRRRAPHRGGERISLGRPRRGARRRSAFGSPVPTIRHRRSGARRHDLVPGAHGPARGCRTGPGSRPRCRSAGVVVVGALHGHTYGAGFRATGRYHASTRVGTPCGSRRGASRTPALDGRRRPGRTASQHQHASTNPEEERHETHQCARVAPCRSGPRRRRLQQRRLAVTGRLGAARVRAPASRRLRPRHPRAPRRPTRSAW